MAAPARPAAAVAVRPPAWLGDLLPAPLQPGKACPLAGEPVPSLALASRAIGRRRELARERGLAVALGVDMIHAAVDALLARMALPRAVALDVLAADDSALAEGVVAGIVRGGHAHDLELACGQARAATGLEHVALTLAGGVIAHAMTPEPGNVVLALRGQGPCDSDFEWTVERQRQLGLDPEQSLPGGDRLADALLVPQASFFSVLRDPLRQRWPARLLVVADGGLTGSLAAALPAGVGAGLDLRAWRPPPPFPQLLADGIRLSAAAAACSVGCGMLVLVPERDVDRWLGHTRAWNEPAEPIGRLTHGAGVEVVG